MARQTLAERVAKLEATFEERTKTIFKLLNDLKESLRETSEKIDKLCNHVSTIQDRVEKLEQSHLTKAEKIKVYGSIAAAAITAVAAIIVALLK